jgi:hypothetical protein
MELYLHSHIRLYSFVRHNLPLTTDGVVDRENVGNQCLWHYPPHVAAVLHSAIQCSKIRIRGKVGVSLPSPEDGNRSSFRKVVFSTYVEFLTLDNIHELSDSECSHRKNPYVPFKKDIMTVLTKYVHLSDGGQSIPEHVVRL